MGFPGMQDGYFATTRRKILRHHDENFATTRRLQNPGDLGDFESGWGFG